MLVLARLSPFLSGITVGGDPQEIEREGRGGD